MVRSFPHKAVNNIKEEDPLVKEKVVRTTSSIMGVELLLSPSLIKPIRLDCLPA
jgi:hypothetical protein